MLLEVKFNPRLRMIIFASNQYFNRRGVGETNIARIWRGTHNSKGEIVCRHEAVFHPDAGCRLKAERVKDC